MPLKLPFLDPTCKVESPHRPRLGALDLLKYIGPGLLVTMGFIDPGNWATNVAAGAQFGYRLLWVITLATPMLIILQHNVAHLGIASGLCLAEAARKYFRPWTATALLITAMGAAIATALAEILGGAIGLHMLFPFLDLRIGAALCVALVLVLVLTNTYRRLEAWVIGFVSIIGLSFVYEVTLPHVAWHEAAVGLVTPAWPVGSIPIILAVLGSVVMPHNLFLHSEIIQSRQWNLEDEPTIRRQLRFEFMDTLFSMLAGWGINCAMIIVAAATFFAHNLKVTELDTAHQMLIPLLGNAAAYVFAVALICAGLASSVTAAVAGATIYSGLVGEPFDICDPHSRWGVVITLVGGLALICLGLDPFNMLILSQIVLSIQLPWTAFAQIALTSSPKVMGSHVNSTAEKVALWVVVLIVVALNILLLATLWK